MARIMGWLNKHPKGARNSIARQESRAAYMFVLPFLIGFVVFSVVPFIYALGISVMNYNSLKDISSIKFTGLDNYVRVFQDPIALQAMGKSLYYTAVYVPGVIVVSFLVAVLFNEKFYLRPLSRTLILIPYVANVVAIAMVWSIVLDPYEGPVNTILKSIGLNPPMWLGGIDSALPTIGMISIWLNFSFQTIVFLAALQGVPRDYYEAAELDGAGRLRKMMNITVPMVSPTTFFLVVTSVIGSFQNYSIVRMLTNGGPGISSRVLSLNIYEEAFSYNKFSYASAQSILQFLIILVFTIILMKGQKKWVHY